MTTVVANATRSALPPEETNVEVRATWRPYPNSKLGRTIAVGDPPPDDADVSVATVTVASGFPNVTGDLPADPSYDLVAAAVAEAVIEGLFPPDRTRDALASEGPDRAIVAERYATASASDALNADTEGYLAEGEVESANDALAARLAARLRPELVATFDSPTAAVRALSVDRVRIVVRTWST